MLNKLVRLIGLIFVFVLFFCSFSESSSFMLKSQVSSLKSQVSSLESRILSLELNRK